MQGFEFLRGFISQRIDLQHLVAIVVDDFHRDFAGLRRIESAAIGRVERGPCRLVNIGTQRAFKFFIRLIRARRMRMDLCGATLKLEL